MCAAIKNFAPFTARAIPIIRSIPKGRVATYAQLAAMAGSPSAARQIVRILHSLSRSQKLPWQRVIRSDGTIALPAGGGREIQIAALKREGVRLSRDGRVDLGKYGWVLGRQNRNGHAEDVLPVRDGKAPKASDDRL